MANSKAQQYEIIKNGPLCLDRLCSDVNPFGEGFNRKNSPLIGGAISNVFKKEKNYSGYYSDGNNEVYVQNGHIIVNDKDMGSVVNRKYVIENVKIDDNDISKNVYLDYIDDDNYIRLNKTTNKIRIRVKTSNTDYSFDANYKANSIYKIEGDVVFFAAKKYRATYVSIEAGFYDHTGQEYSYSTEEFSIEHDGQLCISYNTFLTDKTYFYAKILDKNSEINISDYVETTINHPRGASHPTVVIYNFSENDQALNGILLYIEKVSGGSSYNITNVPLNYAIIGTEHESYTPPVSSHQIGGSGTNGSYTYSRVDRIVHIIPALSEDNIEFFIIDTEYNNRLNLTIEHNFPISLGGYQCDINVRYQNCQSFLDLTSQQTDIASIGTASGGEYVYAIPKPSYLLNYDLSNSYSIKTDNFRKTINENSFNSWSKTWDFFYNSVYAAHTKYKYNSFAPFTHIVGVYKKESGDANAQNLFFAATDFDGKPQCIFNASYSGTMTSRPLANSGYIIAGPSTFLSSSEQTYANKVPQYKFNCRIPISNYSTGWYLLLNEDQMIQGISYASGGIKDMGVLITPWNSIDVDMPVNYKSNNEVTYVSKDGNWKRIKIINTNAIEMSLVDNYVLVNTTQPNNAIDISTGSWCFWASDWNNRLVSLDPSYDTQNISGVRELSSSFKSYRLASAINSQVPTIMGIPSAYLVSTNSFIYNTPASDESDAAIDSYLNTYFYALGAKNTLLSFIQIYLNEKYKTSFKYLSNDNKDVEIEQSYEGMNWSTITSYFNPAIVMSFKKTYANRDIVYFNNEIAFLNYMNNAQVLLYRITSIIENIEAFFYIQGQAYIIQNKKVYNFSIVNDQVSNNALIANITGLKFLTFTPYVAYFWSAIDSSLYGFFADNTIKKLQTMTDISSIDEAIYYPSCNMTVFSTNKGMLCYTDEAGPFIIENIVGKNLFLNKDGFIVGSNNNEVSFYSLWPVFDSEEDMEKEPVKVSTKYYGVGSNIISITDCWYIKLFASSSLYEQLGLNREGKIVLSINAETDKGITSSKEKVINIKESDWDPLTDTLYIRYQPEIQRAVGISLNIESDFAIAYLGVSSIPETTQMSRPAMQV